MTVTCICGEEFSVVDTFNEHAQTCKRYIDGVRLKESYKEVYAALREERGSKVWEAQYTAQPEERKNYPFPAASNIKGFK